jgi:hypothetical protein
MAPKYRWEHKCLTALPSLHLAFIGVALYCYKLTWCTFDHNKPGRTIELAAATVFGVLFRSLIDMTGET